MRGVGGEGGGSTSTRGRGGGRWMMGEGCARLMRGGGVQLLTMSDRLEIWNQS